MARRAGRGVPCAGIIRFKLTGHQRFRPELSAPSPSLNVLTAAKLSISNRKGWVWLPDKRKVGPGSNGVKRGQAEFGLQGLPLFLAASGGPHGPLLIDNKELIK
jgi:hypothetical protein